MFEYLCAELMLIYQFITRIETKVTIGKYYKLVQMGIHEKNLVFYLHKITIMYGIIKMVDLVGIEPTTNRL